MDITQRVVRVMELLVTRPGTTAGVDDLVSLVEDEDGGCDDDDSDSSLSATFALSNGNTSLRSVPSQMHWFSTVTDGYARSIKDYREHIPVSHTSLPSFAAAIPTIPVPAPNSITLSNSINEHGDGTSSWCMPIKCANRLPLKKSLMNGR
jgi:hypothetical protein